MVGYEVKNDEFGVENDNEVRSGDGEYDWHGLNDC